MTVGILYFKNENNKIYDYIDKVTAVTDVRVDFEGGSMGDFNKSDIGILVTDSLTIVYGELLKDANLGDNPPSHLIDNNGNVFNRGDILPDGLSNLNSQYQKKTFEDLEQEYEKFKTRLETAESAILDLIVGGM